MELLVTGQPEFKWTVRQLLRTNFNAISFGKFWLPHKVFKRPVHNRKWLIHIILGNCVNRSKIGRMQLRSLGYHHAKYQTSKVQKVTLPTFGKSYGYFMNSSNERTKPELKFESWNSDRFWHKIHQNYIRFACASHVSIRTPNYSGWFWVSKHPSEHPFQTVWKHSMCDIVRCTIAIRLLGHRTGILNRIRVVKATFCRVAGWAIYISQSLIESRSRTKQPSALD